MLINTNKDVDTAPHGHVAFDVPTPSCSWCHDEMARIFFQVTSEEMFLKGLAEVTFLKCTLFFVLFFNSWVIAEFYRITQTDLKKTFFSSFDEHTTQMIKLYREQGEAFGDEMKTLRDNKTFA